MADRPRPYYADDAVTIYHGDCRELLPLMPKVDLVLTDPPYLMQMGHGGGAFGVDKREYLRDTRGFTDGGFDMQLLAPFSPWMCFCSKEQLVPLITLASVRRWCLLTWNKPNPTPSMNQNYLPDTEYIVHSFETGDLHGDYSTRARWFMYPAGSGEGDHPNAKPVSLMRKLVQVASAEGATILDPFMGSGTTLRAAKDLGRKAIGIEIEERYCEIAAKRMSQTVMAL